MHKEQKLAFAWRALFECCNREPNLAFAWRALFECYDREPKLAFAWRTLNAANFFYGTVGHR